MGLLTYEAFWVLHRNWRRLSWSCRSPSLDSTMMIRGSGECDFALRGAGGDVVCGYAAADFPGVVWSPASRRGSWGGRFAGGEVRAERIVCSCNGQHCSMRSRLGRWLGS